MEENTVKKLEMMLEYSNLTNSGKETVQQAIQMLKQGNRNDWARKATERIEELLQQLKEEYLNDKTLHVLTLGEIYTASTPMLVWIEINDGRVFPLEMIGISYNTENEAMIMFSDGNEDNLMDEGTIFRLWSDKPTEEERDAVPWEKPEA